MIVRSVSTWQVKRKRCPCGSPFEEGSVVKVSLYHFDPLTRQVLCCVTAGITLQCPYIPSSGQQVADDCATLSPQ
jgi:hypothetical protein